ncbi:MAG: hypothetical protein OK454_08770, partial [Thaumarchaeota archaeon]|nr:hypothetical protein [Nitrososphaerota archaeon]
LFSKKELDWHANNGLRISATLLRTIAMGFAEEVDHGAHRLLGRYDTTVYRGERIPLQAMTMNAFKDLNAS